MWILVMAPQTRCLPIYLSARDLSSASPGLVQRNEAICKWAISD